MGNRVSSNVSLSLMEQLIIVKIDYRLSEVCLDNWIFDTSLKICIYTQP